jgi:hypothetical protein
MFTYKIARFFCVVLVLLAAFSSFIYAAENEGMQEFDNFLRYYYLHPQPQKAGTMLKYFTGASFFDEAIKEKPKNLDTVAYFFSRIALLEPWIVDDYLPLFKKGSHEQRCFMLKILQVCGNQKVKTFFESSLKQGDFQNEKEQIQNAIEKGIPNGFNPLTRPVIDGGDLDFLWMEFMATGKEEPVVRIIETLKDYDSRNQGAFIVARVAEWSLNSFCREHEKVMTICKKRISQLKGITKERLETLVGDIEIERLPDLIPNDTMIKAVIRELTPDRPGEPANPEKKTYYRLGNKFWRVHKNLNRMIILVKDPDIWIIGAENNKGVHFVGPYSKNYFYPSIHSTDKKIILRGLQLGTETQFMEARKSQKKSVYREGEACILYAVDTENVHVELLCKQKESKQIPWKLTVSEENMLLFSCIYDEYSCALEPDMSLFNVPENVKITEEPVNLKDRSSEMPAGDGDAGLMDPFIRERLPEGLK